MGPDENASRVNESDGCTGKKNAALLRLAEALTHKVNNHLTYVMNYVFILKNSPPDFDKSQIVQKIEQGIIKAKDVLQMVVDMASPQSASLEDLDIRDVIEEEIRTIKESALGKPIDLSADLEGSSKVRATRKGLHKIFLNLIENSAESGATRVNIRSRAAGEFVEVVVKDNGPGVSSEISNLIFEPFFTTKQSASGFGLFIVYNTLRSYGGNIRLRSGESGSEFILLLPKA